MDAVIAQNTSCLCHIVIGRYSNHLLLHNLVGMIEKASFKIFGEHKPVGLFGRVKIDKLIGRLMWQWLIAAGHMVG